jgi:hypothetical protein
MIPRIDRRLREPDKEFDLVYADFQKWNPLRPPNWRWDFVVASVKTRHFPAAEYLGCWIVPAYKYAWSLATVSIGETRVAQAQEMSDIAAAHGIYATNGRLRWELEARILSGEPVDVVSRKTGLPKSVVECYVGVFFDVLDRLDAYDYIDARVIRGAFCHPLSGEDVARIWKLNGFWAGPVMLDAVIDHFVQRGKPDYSYLLDEPSMKDAPPFQRSLERAIRLDILPLNDPEIQILVMRLRLELIENERKTRTGDAGKRQKSTAEFCEYGDALIVELLAKKRAQAAMKEKRQRSRRGRLAVAST